MSSIKSLLFVFEVYHVVTHTLVMTGYRTLPRKILSKQKYYFLFDLLTSLASLIIHGRFWPIIVLQNIQHAFYFLTWPEGSWLTSRVLSWSSLDWDRGRWSQLDLVLGTSFDILTHAINSYCLFQVLDYGIGIIAIHLLIVALMTVGILWNSKLAWANANNLENAPSWVKNRVKPLTKEQSQKWDVVESLGIAIFGQ